MVSFSKYACVASACLALSCSGLSSCGESSSGSAGEGGSGTAGSGGTAGAAATRSTGGTDGTNPPAKEPLVLFVGGFMSEYYEAASIGFESTINNTLRAKARTLNVHIDLPLNQSIDIRIGDAIANALPWISLPIEPGGFISFATQEAYFDRKDINVDNQVLAHESVAFDSAESVGHNASAILEYLRSSPHQIVIVSHSKGGLDTLDALLQAPDLWGDTVVGWVALQAPFHGTPIAVSPSSVNAFLLGAIGGNGQSLDDLKSDGRIPYMANNDEAIKNLTTSIPVISAYSTYVATESLSASANQFANSIINSTLISQITQIVVDNYWDTPLDVPGVISRSTASSVTLIRQRVNNALDAAVAAIGLMDLTNTFMNVGGIPNDGLVPRDSTALPGAIHRELTLGDHASPVMDVDSLKNFWTAAHRNQVTLELVNEVRARAAVASD